MFPMVQAQFRAFNEPFEGCVPYMYLDVLGLVTVGVGNLIDPVTEATILPFRLKAGQAPASPERIAAEWQKLKDDTTLARRGHLACESITELELGDDALNALIAKRLGANEASLKRQAPFRAFESWPADAQLALLSMAWAMGPAALPGFHHFCAACDSMDFHGASTMCKINEIGNPGVIPRNKANCSLLANAGAVLGNEAKFQRSKLYYPSNLT